MSERGATVPPGLVSDHQIAEALEVLLRDATAATSLTSLNAVVQQLEAKLCVSLSHRIDFIRQQIQHFLLHSHPHPHPHNFIPQHHHHHHRDHFSISQQQTPNFHAQLHHHQQNFSLHHLPEGYAFHPPPPQLQPQPHLSARLPPTPPPFVKDTAAATPSVPPKERLLLPSSFSPVS